MSKDPDILNSQDDFPEEIDSDTDRFPERAAVSAPRADTEDSPDKAVTQHEWLTKPSVADQLRRFPETVKLDYPKTEILNLSKPEDLERYNTLKQAAHPASFTSCVISTEDIKFHDGVWFAFVTHQQLLYQKLL